MTLETNPTLGNGGDGMQGSGPGSAARMIRELQRLTTVVIDGAAANTSIAVAGLGASDTIQSAIMYAAGVPSNVTANATVYSAGNVRFNVTTAGNKVVLSFYKKPA